MNPEDPRHGTPRGYRVHREHGEPSCDPCAAAWYRYNKRTTYLREIGQPLRVPSLGTKRRVRALMALGYGMPQQAADLGIATGNLSYKMQQPYVARRTHEAVSDLFERLAMAPPPEGWVAQRTRNIARKRGWLPPLAWDDIDDPNEQPAPGDNQRHNADVDRVVVERVMAGENLPTTRAEKDEIVRRWRALGWSLNELERRTGWKCDRYGREPLQEAS